MKKTRKLWAFLLAMIMVLAMGMSAMAAGTGKITITPPTGTADDATNTYKIYKVFDADGDGTNISYKLVAGKTDAPEGFNVDEAGNVTYVGKGGVELTPEDIEKIAAYVKEDDLVDTVTTTGTASAESKPLENGFYFIRTSTGSVVTIDSTNPNATVQDKNVLPTLDKDIASVNGITGTGADNENDETATAQIGDTINYSVNITVGKGHTNYTFKDKLSSGLTLVEDSLRVTIGGSATGIGNYYEAYKFTNETDENLFDIGITFSNLNEIVEGAIINISYSAILNENAIIEGQGNKNSATLDYGSSTLIGTTPPDEPKVYTYRFQLVKDNSEDIILSGAKFKIYDAATGGNEIKIVETLTGEYVVADPYNTNEGVEIVAGTPIINGLAAGKTYWLEETEAPAGYNKLTERIKFVINEDVNATTGLSTAMISVNDEEEVPVLAITERDKYIQDGVEVENNKGAELPSTGGIGTTIFYVAGGALVLAAVVLLVTRKRMSVEK